MKITFCGAVEEVTGSRYLVEFGDVKILVDCGLFQGEKELTRRNWDPFPVDPKTIDAIILTHAHIDHTGYIPALVKNGFIGKIYCSPATFALCAIVLEDSGFLQEEDAKRHQVAPLYTLTDVARSLNLFQTVAYDTAIPLGTSATATLIRSGHILGSSFVVIFDGKKTLTFSGDLGRPHDLIMKAPTHLKQTDFLVIESTYGNRLHKNEDPIEAIGKVIDETIEKGGMLIIPAFAVARTQTILYCLYQLKLRGALPKIPIFLDSPMGIQVTELYGQFRDEHTLSATVCRDAFNIATYTATVQESKKIEHVRPPAIIIAGSGMADGGRVVEHLKDFISDARNTVFFVGYQARGTSGRALIDGAQSIDIQGRSYEVRAEIKSIISLSAHADYDEILQWLSYFENTPEKVFVTHGELESAESLEKKIEERFGWSVVVPKYLQSFTLD